MNNQVTFQDLQNFKFSSEEVLRTEDEITERGFFLNRAMKLGNNFNLPVFIEFSSAFAAIFKIETKIWAITEKYVVIDQGFLIPIRSVYNIRFC